MKTRQGELDTIEKISAFQYRAQAKNEGREEARAAPEHQGSYVSRRWTLEKDCLCVPLGNPEY